MRDGPMASTTQPESLELRRSRAASIGDGPGAKLVRLARHMGDALEAWRRNEIDGEIAQFVARSGRLTDNQEREINLRLLGYDWDEPRQRSMQSWHGWPS